MSTYNYKYELYDPYEYSNFSGYVITQTMLLYVDKNRVLDQWDLNPAGNDTNSLIKAAREEADLSPNAKIFIDDAKEIDLDKVSDYGYIAGEFTDEEEDEDGWNDLAEHFADL